MLVHRVWVDLGEYGLNQCAANAILERSQR